MSIHLHVQNICSLYCDPPTTISLYKSQVLSLLDNTSVVCDPHLQTPTESIQSFATTVASKLWRESSATQSEI